MRDYLEHQVLVVEDDPAIARLVMLYLREAGWHPVHAPDGMTAFRLWADCQPSLVLLDVMLPDLSGWEICSAFRAESTVPIIMLTAKSADHDVVQGLNLGADDYLAKPFTHAQLLARINAVIRRVEHHTAVDEHEEEQEHEATASVAPPLPMETLPGATLLRNARQESGMTLYQVERRTGLRWDYLQALEHGAFETIPMHQIRETMLKYCQFLEIDARPLFEQAQRAYLRQSHVHVINRIVMFGLAATIVVLALLPWMLGVF